MMLSSIGSTGVGGPKPDMYAKQTIITRSLCPLSPPFPWFSSVTSRIELARPFPHVHLQVARNSLFTTMWAFPIIFNSNKWRYTESRLSNASGKLECMKYVPSSSVPRNRIRLLLASLAVPDQKVRFQWVWVCSDIFLSVEARFFQDVKIKLRVNCLCEFFYCTACQYSSTLISHSD